MEVNLDYSLIPVKPLHDFLYIDIIDRNVTEKKVGDNGKLFLLADDYIDRIRNPIAHKHPGIRPRWARVLAIGPDAIGDVELGDMVLCDTLTWSRKIPMGRDNLELVYFWRICVKNILLIDNDLDRNEYVKEFKSRNINMTIGKI